MEGDVILRQYMPFNINSTKNQIPLFHSEEYIHFVQYKLCGEESRYGVIPYPFAPVKTLSYSLFVKMGQQYREKKVN